MPFISGEVFASINMELQRVLLLLQISCMQSDYFLVIYVAGLCTCVTVDRLPLYLHLTKQTKILNVKGKAVVKRLASKTSWVFCCTYLVEITLVKILDLTPILSLFILLRVTSHYMMLLMFIVTETTGSWGKMLVMEATLEVFYLSSSVAGKIKSLNCLWKLKSSWF